MRIKVPSISDNEAIEAFITGLRFHDALRDKLLRKRPELVTALLAIAKKYANADDAKKIIIKEAARVPRSDHPHTMTTTVATVVGTTILTAATSATTPATTTTSVISGVTAVTITGASMLGKTTARSTPLKKGGGRRNYEDDYAKALKGPCQLHPKSNHTMENCRVLKSIYMHQQAPDTSDMENCRVLKSIYMRQQAPDTSDKPNDAGE
jgi:hypothetical protein